MWVGGQDVLDLPLGRLRRSVGYVPQESFLFSRSLRDNVRLADESAGPERLEAVARTAGLTDDLGALPRGWDTVVGERGLTLSGGQRQRVALARALVADPPFLVLDDVLASVDAAKEWEITRALRGAASGRTTLADDPSAEGGRRGRRDRGARRGPRGRAGPPRRPPRGRRPLRPPLACPAAGGRCQCVIPMREPEQEDEVLGKAYDARLMGRLWAFTRPHLRLVLATCALFPAVALLELSQPYLIKIAIDDHILRRDWAGLGGVAALFLLVLVALYALRATQAYLTQLTGQRVIHDLRAALFAHLQRQDARFYDRSPVGRLMTRVLNDGEAIQELFTSGVVALLGDVVVLTGVVVIMLGMNWKLALVTFALVPLLVLAAAYFRVRARDSYRVVRTRLARMNAFLQESLQGHERDPALRARGPGARRRSRSSPARCAPASSARRSTTPPSTPRWRPWARPRWPCCSGTGAGRW